MEIIEIIWLPEELEFFSGLTAMIASNLHQWCWSIDQVVRPSDSGCEAVCTYLRNMALLHCCCIAEQLKSCNFKEKAKCLTCNGQPNTWRLLADLKMPALPAFYHVMLVVFPWRQAAQRRPRFLNFARQSVTEWQQTPAMQNLLTLSLRKSAPQATSVLLAKKESQDSLFKFDCTSTVPGLAL